MVWITLPHDFDEENRDWKRYSNPPRMQSIAFNKNTYLDNKCALDVASLPHKTIRATAIACNIGYINRDVESLLRMMKAGMNIAHINLSLNHGNFDYHTQTIKNIRQAAINYSNILGVYYPVAISIDTVGSEIQTGYLEGGENAEIELITGNIVKITTDPAYMDKCSTQVIYIDCDNIFSTITVGRTIYIDEGAIHLEVQSISGAFMTCKILMGGILGNKKGIHLPGSKVDLPALAEIDKKRIEYAIKNNLDILFCSLVREPNAILEIRDLLGDKGRHIKLIANIGSLQGLENLDSIIKVSDGIVISRGDLFLEVTVQKLFLAQKYIAAKCNKAGCPVFASRELIESMKNSRQAIRAEVTDVANTVLDGCDVLMLTKETTGGQYFVDIVNFVSHICKEAEATAWRTSMSERLKICSKENILLETLSITVVDSSIKCRASMIIVITDTGDLATTISKYRPRCPIIAITRNTRVARQLHLYRSIIPLLYANTKKQKVQKDIDYQVAAGIAFGKNRLYTQANDPVVIAIENIKNGKDFNNSMRIKYVPEKHELINGVLSVY